MNHLQEALLFSVGRQPLPLDCPRGHEYHLCLREKQHLCWLSFSLGHLLIHHHVPSPLVHSEVTRETVLESFRDEVETMSVHGHRHQMELSPALGHRLCVLKRMEGLSAWGSWKVLTGGEQAACSPRKGQAGALRRLRPETACGWGLWRAGLCTGSQSKPAELVMRFRQRKPLYVMM